MAHLARRLLALVSIVGGGVLGAAPTALAAPSDPTPSVPPSTTEAASTPSPPSVTVPVRTGFADLTAPERPIPGADPSAAATLRTGFAADLGSEKPPSPAPGASPRPPAAPAPAAPTPAAPVPVSRPSPTTTPAPDPGHPTAPAPSATPAATAPPPAGYTVVAGDSLWSIAASQVAAASGRTAPSVPAGDVAPYWQALCAANRASLRSGDLNVIYPGEQVTLPRLGA